MFKSKFTNIEESFTFDDILIKPAYSDVAIQEVDISLRLTDKLCLSNPIFSAAMDTVTGYEMARAMISAGACGPLHKNTPIDKNVEFVRKLSQEFGDSKPIAVSVGVGNNIKDISALVDAGANVIVVDSAHGHSKNVGDLVEMIHVNFPDVFLIAGNVVTKEGAEFLVGKGAKAVKVGLGPGSICTTRKVTGIGRGQVSSVAEVADYCHGKGILVISDGGCRSTDEIMKSIACGADAVMLGYMLAGCLECPGDELVINDQKYKAYRGMGSLASMKAGSASRYGQENVDSGKWVPEGVEGYVPLKGEVKEELKVIEQSLKTSFGYIGARDINEAKSKSHVTRITNSVLVKSNIHSIDLVKKN